MAVRGLDAFRFGRDAYWLLGAIVGLLVIAIVVGAISSAAAEPDGRQPRRADERLVDHGRHLAGALACGPAASCCCSRFCRSTRCARS